jgi:hypothetical protein
VKVRERTAYRRKRREASTEASQEYGNAGDKCTRGKTQREWGSLSNPIGLISAVTGKSEFTPKPWPSAVYSFKIFGSASWLYCHCRGVGGVIRPRPIRVPGLRPPLKMNFDRLVRSTRLTPPEIRQSPRAPGHVLADARNASTHPHTPKKEAASPKLPGAAWATNRRQVQLGSLTCDLAELARAWLW